MDTNNLSPELTIYFADCLSPYKFYCVNFFLYFFPSSKKSKRQARKSVHVFGNEGFCLTSMIWEPANRAETNGCSVVDSVALVVLYYANGHFERWQAAGWDCGAHLKTSTGIIKENTKGRTGFFIRISWSFFFSKFC